MSKVEKHLILEDLGVTGEIRKAAKTPSKKRFIKAFHLFDPPRRDAMNPLFSSVLEDFSHLPVTATHRFCSGWNFDFAAYSCERGRNYKM